MRTFIRIRAILRHGGRVVPGRLAILGMAAALVAWSLGLGRGFEQGFSEKIQEIETGQVQLVSTKGGFERYFALRALIEGIAGVEATSARLEFTSHVTNSQGETRTIRIRAVSFAQEGKVTNLAAQVLNRDRPLSGLIVPRSWEGTGFLPLQSVALVYPPGAGKAISVPVNGSLKTTFAPDGFEFALLDLDAAFQLLGPEAKVTAFAIRLKPGVRPQAWVAAHQDSFVGTEGDLQTWRVLSEKQRTQARTAAVPLLVLQNLVLALGLLILTAMAWDDANRRQSTLRNWMALASPWVGLFALLVGMVGGFLTMVAVVWLLEGSWLAAMRTLFPLLGTRLPWRWGTEVWLVPVILLAVSLLLPAARPRRGKPGPLVLGPPTPL